MKENILIIGIKKSDPTLFISNRSYPDRYNKLLTIYNSGRTVITGSHTETNSHTILNKGEHTDYANPEDSTRPSYSWSQNQ
jgi:hypothetical protein